MRTITSSASPTTIRSKNPSNGFGLSIKGPPPIIIGPSDLSSDFTFIPPSLSILITFVIFSSYERENPTISILLSGVFDSSVTRG